MKTIRVTWSLSVVLLLAVSFSAVAAPGPSKSVQAYISYQIINHGEPIYGALFVSSPRQGVVSTGNTNHYPVLKCQGNKKTLMSVPIFTGVILTTHTSHGSVIIDVKGFAANLSQEQKARFRAGKCTMIAPPQRTILSKSVSFPAKVTSKPASIPLGNGYSFKYSVISVTNLTGHSSGRP